ncbi:MAG: hypothetical protein A3H51_01015 [Candidatus Spechtbacteria bacterium RIFCSPLOWO2_02_FULL_38_8]|uniref:PrgI family protein n=1 Tax=Candidatus Spechtbacteria bacterium RIFCSPLOWO2_02_FULL_38_8 TaxID=1802164 RepID=A0A1G2HLA8_9BACT|nr:MAG: hypothetical protein A3H51_01015 [Candidatus Spechtbacteria bacterium RIFCSPLOWO2_02_FULL_38_8]
MQESVPQFIDREQKLLGPLTVRQTVVLGLTVLILILSYFLLNFFVFSILFVVLGSSGVAIAFIKINDQPLYKVIASFFGYFVKPRKYLWERKENDSGIPKKPKSSSRKEEMAALDTKQITESDIKNLAEFLDR